MNYATILVHIDLSDACFARARLAARLARRLGSHLVALLPTGLHDGLIPEGAIATGVGDFMAESVALLRQRTGRVAEEFKDAITGAGPLSYEIRQVDGPVVDALTRHGRAADLVVLGQEQINGLGDALSARDIPARVMMQVGRPVLIVPYAGSFEDVGHRALLAWDGSRESALAMREALPLLDRAGGAKLLSFVRPDEHGDDGALQSQAMTQWLSRHGLQLTVERQVTGIPVAEAMLTSASDLSADLIVMGGYGHARLREIMLGGVTRDILARMTVPALMAH